MKETKRNYVDFTKSELSENGDSIIVEGYATTKDIDSHGDIITLDAIKKAFAKYVERGNIREMHQPIAVGKVLDAFVDDVGLYIKAEIVDSNAIKKIIKGVYTGFSIGASVIKRVGKVFEEIDILEVSVVDVPANRSSRFIDIIKFEDEGINMDLDKKEIEVEVSTGESQDNSMEENEEMEKGNMLDKFMTEKGLSAEEIMKMCEEKMSYKSFEEKMKEKSMSMDDVMKMFDRNDEELLNKFEQYINKSIEKSKEIDLLKLENDNLKVKVKELEDSLILKNEEIQKTELIQKNISEKDLALNSKDEEIKILKSEIEVLKTKEAPVGKIITVDKKEDSKSSMPNAFRERHEGIKALFNK